MPPTDPTAALRTALAEGLHKAMCFSPPGLHNRLACHRAGVYMSIAEAALEHPAVGEIIGVQQRSSDAAFGALGAVADELSAWVSPIGETHHEAVARRSLNPEYDRLLRPPPGHPGHQGLASQADDPSVDICDWCQLPRGEH